MHSNSSSTAATPDPNLGGGASNSKSEEKVIMGTTCNDRNKASSVNLDSTKGYPKNESQFSSNEVEAVLSDFKKLNFEDNKCFGKIVDDYQKKNIPLFNYVILNKREEIIDILDERHAPSDQEEFRRELGRYLLQIDGGASYGQKLQNELQFSSHEVEEVLSDFKKLNFNFKDNKCEDPSDAINYNNGWPADPFDKIANYYREDKNIFLFNYVVLSKQKEIMDILDEKLSFKDEDQERLKERREKKNKFEERLGRYLLRISEGMDDGKELLGSDNLIAFFDGCYVACKYAGRALNHHDLLNINITQPGQTLETSRLFTEKIKRMEEEKSEVKRAKIYSNGKRVVTMRRMRNNRATTPLKSLQYVTLKSVGMQKMSLEKTLTVLLF